MTKFKKGDIVKVIHFYRVDSGVEYTEEKWNVNVLNAYKNQTPLVIKSLNSSRPTYNIEIPGNDELWAFFESELELIKIDDWKKEFVGENLTKKRKTKAL